MMHTELLEWIGVPKRICSVLRDIEPNVPKEDLHRNLFLYGPAGTGKSVQAAAILSESLFSKIHVPSIQDMLDPESPMYIGDHPPMFAKRYIFARVPDMLQRFKKSFSRYAEENEGDLIDLYSQARLLVLDDIGAEMATDWAYLTLYLIVDNRYNEMLPTIFTSNLDLNALSKAFVDERLVSRIIEMCGVKGIRKMGEKTGPNYRKEILKKGC